MCYICTDYKLTIQYTYDICYVLRFTMMMRSDRTRGVSVDMWYRVLVHRQASVCSVFFEGIFFSVRNLSNCCHGSLDPSGQPLCARSPRSVRMCASGAREGCRVAGLSAIQRSLDIISDGTPDAAPSTRVESRWERWRPNLAVALSGASIYCLGGVVFGIGSLYPILYHSHVMEGLCHPAGSTPPYENSTCPERADGSADGSVESSSAVGGGSLPCCVEQQLRYTLLTSIAFFITDGAVLLYGEIADRVGPRACFGMGAG